MFILINLSNIMTYHPLFTVTEKDNSRLCYVIGCAKKRGIVDHPERSTRVLFLIKTIPVKS